MLHLLLELQLELPLLLFEVGLRLGSLLRAELPPWFGLGLVRAVAAQSLVGALVHVSPSFDC